MKNRWIGFVGGGLIGLALGITIGLAYFSPTQSSSQMSPMMDHSMMGGQAMMANQATMHTGGMMGWPMVTMAGFWIGVLLLLIWIALTLLARPTASTQAPADSPDSLTILQQRFARGEISRGEFEEMRGVLSQ